MRFPLTWLPFTQFFYAKVLIIGSGSQVGDDDGTEDYFDNGDFDANIEGSGNNGIEQGNLLKGIDNKNVRK